MKDIIGDYLEKFIRVPFNIVIQGNKRKMGEGEPLFTVTFNKELSKKELMASTSLALGEAYMRGDIEVDRDLYFVLDLFLGNMAGFSTDSSLMKHIIKTSRSKRNQKKEVSSHYDIGNDFYSLWLDETLSYSCAYFKNETDTLNQAQINKADHTLEKLRLEPGMTLLDIGCGWGFLLRRAVEKYGVKGVGITLSEEQCKKFNADIKSQGLSDSIRAEILDYRDTEKLGIKFDRVVSVGMLEHVGRGNYGIFMEQVKKIMKPGGLFLLHYISALKEHPGDVWMKKYIFPGGTIPSLREIINVMGDLNFYTLDVESLRRHYNRTLRCWRENFNNHRNEIIKMQGEEFTRMWDLYLAACAATFNNGIIDVHQILMSNGVNNELPMTRIV